MKKQGRGSTDFHTEENDNIIAVKWFDSEPVHIISSYAGINPIGSVRRWSLTEQRYVMIDQPRIVNE